MLAWYDRAHRELPWRTPAPDAATRFYRVWLSEIMLQQTRVEAVIRYYTRFLEAFPTIAELAAAPESDVLTLWSGLGYYSRARNLHRAAKQIAATGLPRDYEAVRALPGIGPYTAAAVASIALELPHAAVDGNVIRVVSRIHNDASEVTSGPARRQFAAYADGLLDPRRPGDFNQAMMELGAIICIPRAPLCGSCPVSRHCAAHTAGTARELPVKLKKPAVREVDLDLAILEHNNSVYLVRRASTERRLADFWELPAKNQFPRRWKLKEVSGFRHQIVNDRFRVTVWRACLAKAPSAIPIPEGAWVSVADFARMPLTTITRKALSACFA